MNLAIIIYYFSSIIWIFPPIKQYGGRYFYFFLILALSDIFSVISYTSFHYDPLNIYILVSYSLLLSLISFDVLRKKIFFVASGFAASLLVLYFSLINLMWLLFLIHLGIIFLILKSVLLLYFSGHRIMIFHLLLIFYEFTVIFKFAYIFLEGSTGYLFFYSTTLVQIAFAAAFMIFSDCKKPQLHNG